VYKKIIWELQFAVRDAQFHIDLRLLSPEGFLRHKDRIRHELEPLALLILPRRSPAHRGIEKMKTRAGLRDYRFLLPAEHSASAVHEPYHFIIQPAPSSLPSTSAVSSIVSDGISLIAALVVSRNGMNQSTQHPQNKYLHQRTPKLFAHTILTPLPPRARTTIVIIERIPHFSLLESRPKIQPCLSELMSRSQFVSLPFHCNMSFKAINL
jgi:hypothetical protein